MTPDDFSALARTLAPGIQEKATFDNVQFSISGKVFATVGWPEVGYALVKIAPSRQTWALRLSQGLAIEPSRRRNSGIVRIRLAAIDEGSAVELLAAALAFGYSAPGLRTRSAVSPGAISRRLSA